MNHKNTPHTFQILAEKTVNKDWEEVWQIMRTKIKTTIKQENLQLPFSWDFRDYFSPSTLYQGDNFFFFFV